MTRINSVIFVALVLTAAVSGQQAPIGYDDTPMQPNGKWRVHDGARPHPPIVTPPPAPNAPLPAPRMRSSCSVRETISVRGRWPTDRRPTWPMKGGVLQTGKGMLRTSSSSPTCSCTSSSRRRPK